ncbi:aminoglycoside phosphotransferase family protein [Streptomyces sp. Q6]|uniref:Aminoglycoside phosphotransferase family protein n=1 Tax=Streptomyces citrinus TaxID=3118173 RepID=A0ACD5AAL4_9ACTN
MQAPESARARTAALDTATALGLPATEALVLHDSNKLTLRLLPCDVVARVAPAAHGVARFEIALAQRLTEAGCPVATPACGPRVLERDGFDITLWTYYAPTPRPEIPAPAYAQALHRLHSGMRTLDVPTPHYTDRIAQAMRLLADPDRTPALADADRALLRATLSDLSRVVAEHGGPEQLLHGEPHPGNLLATESGPRFIDFETCCRGPVAFDLAHAPEEVGAHCPGVDQTVLRACRTLVLAMVTTWRWDRDDRLPNGRRLATEWLGRLRDAAHGVTNDPPLF